MKSVHKSPDSGSMKKGLDLLKEIFYNEQEIDYSPLLKYWYVLPERWRLKKKKPKITKKVKKLMEFDK